MKYNLKCSANTQDFTHKFFYFIVDKKNLMPEHLSTKTNKRNVLMKLLCCYKLQVITDPSDRSVSVKDKRL